jgi:outer membrane receptor protein involved in Fe transport
MRSGVLVTLVLGLLVALPAASQNSPGPQSQGAQSQGPQPQAEEGAPLETVLVTGSRIPRLTTLDAGPAPVVTITGEDILQKGFTDMSDVMRNLNQNLGSLDNNTSTDGFSPGAQAVDLRGLGPNHTLVLVNGRRIADYPQAYGGNSNFTDISNIPTTMIDRIEVLSGSDSAVYGSDAIAGVINFILKKRADGTTIDFRDGETQLGGGSSQRFTLTSGYSNDRFDSIFSLQLLNQQPVWAFRRSFTDSTLDAAGGPSNNYADPVFGRYDLNGNFIAPSPATCSALSGLDGGSVFYASRPDYGPTGGPGYYCGSRADIGYGTLENGRKSINLYGSTSYELTEHMSLFADLQAGYSHQDSYNSPLQWQNSVAMDGGSVPVPFYDSATGQIEQWQRQYFTPNEEGGFEAGEIHNFNTTISLNVGLRGSFGHDWTYEAFYGHSQSKLVDETPALLDDKAAALYLGPSLGIDPASGFNIYNAPPSRLYTPLTVAQFRSISNLSTDDDKSHTDSLNFSATNPELVRLPAGPLGFAAVAEAGHDSLVQNVDPLSLTGDYYDYHNTGATGSRNRYGLGTEFNIPIFPMLTATAATRFDNYSYNGTSSGKVTYNAGLEFRPIQSLLIRGSYGTGFRAPDLSYLYAGPSGSSSGGIDYYLCRLKEPSTGPTFDNCDYNNVYFDGASHGSTALKDETSTSLTYGVVFAPWRTLRLSVDYYRISLKNEVIYQSSDQLLREEADCRLGSTPTGQPVAENSSQCQQVEGQVTREPASFTLNPLGIIAVDSLPVNAAEDRTSGIDLDGRYALDLGRAGIFDFSLAITNVLTHTIEYPGTPPDDELEDLYNYVIPRYKATASISWTLGPVTTTFYGQRIGGLPNYDGTERLPPTNVYNASLTYHIGQQAQLSLACDNVFDTPPQFDPTWVSYPYYNHTWFNPVGRSFLAEFSYRFDWPKK